MPSQTRKNKRTKKRTTNNRRKNTRTNTRKQARKHTRNQIRESQQEKYGRLRKIRAALVASKGWFSQNQSCDYKGDLYVAYPYDDMRTCLKLSIHQPIPFDSKERLNYVRRYIGGPLGFKYQIGNGPVRYDAR